jgi:hypothetical protein
MWIPLALAFPKGTDVATSIRNRTGATSFCSKRAMKKVHSVLVLPALPRPSHRETDYFEQEEWKKKLASEVTQVQKKYLGADVEVWTMDELANWS